MEPLLRLFKTRQRRKPFVKALQLAARVDDPAARALQLQAYLRFPSRKRGVPVNEAFQQEREFLGAFREFGYLMLPKDFHTGHHVLR